MPLAYLIVATCAGSVALVGWLVSGGGALSGLAIYSLGGQCALAGCVMHRAMTRIGPR